LSVIFKSNLLKMKTKLSPVQIGLIVVIVLLLFCIVRANRNKIKEGFMSLSNDFSGKDKCLDSGLRENLMAPCGKFSGQQWSAVEPVKPTMLMSQNPELQNKCLDLNRGNPLMMECNNQAPQLWTIEKDKKIKNVAAGPNNCLDIINDGQNNKMQMRPCGNFSGQKWNVGKN